MEISVALTIVYWVHQLDIFIPKIFTWKITPQKIWTMLHRTLVLYATTGYEMKQSRCQVKGKLPGHTRVTVMGQESWKWWIRFAAPVFLCVLHHWYCFGPVRNPFCWRLICWWQRSFVWFVGDRDHSYWLFSSANECKRIEMEVMKNRQSQGGTQTGFIYYRISKTENIVRVDSKLLLFIFFIEWCLQTAGLESPFCSQRDTTYVLVGSFAFVLLCVCIHNFPPAKATRGDTTGSLHIAISSWHGVFQP